jgi:hypothetical protein
LERFVFHILHICVILYLYGSLIFCGRHSDYKEKNERRRAFREVREQNQAEAVRYTGEKPMRLPPGVCLIPHAGQARIRQTKGVLSYGGTVIVQKQRKEK